MTMRNGGFFTKLAIVLVILGIIAYIGVPLFLSYVRFLSIKDRMNEVAKFGKTYSIQEIRELIIERANENGVSLRQEAIQIQIFGDVVHIETYYQDTLSYFGGRWIKILTYNPITEKTARTAPRTF